MEVRATAVAPVPESLVWPLVGREPELARIASARAARAGGGVVLSAAAGVGKSRLARDAVAAAERDGAPVSWVQATRSAATVPLGAFAGLLAGVRSDDPLELMRRGVDALRERAGDQRLVLGVDDAQLLDPTSAALVLQLASTGTAFVVATVRSDEPCPDAVRSLWKDAAALRLDLRPLTEHETATLIEAVLDGPVEQGARRWVFDSSQGNALYVRELLTGALAGGALEQTGGHWRLTRRPPPSRPLTELVTARMAALTGPERRAIELLALGEPLPLAEIVALAGDDALAAAESDGLIAVGEPAAGGEVRLAHPLYGDVVRTSMPVVRAAQARRELARLVQARPERSDDDALRIARWLLDAGEATPAPLLVAAARAANLAGDAELGARLAGLAVADGAGAEAALLLARAHAVRKRYEEAEAVLAGLHGTIADRAPAIDYLQQRIVVLYRGLRRMDDALALLDEARDWWPDQAWRRELDPLRVHLLSMAAGFGGAVAGSQEILADPELGPAVRRRAELVHATNLFYSGRVREARELIVRRPPAVPLRDETDEIACILWCVIGLESGWDLAALDDAMSATLRAGVKANDHAASGIAAAALGGLRLLAGRYVDAARWFAEAVSQFEHRDPFHTLPVAHAMLAVTAYQRGDPDAAAAAIERCRAAIGGREPVDTDRAYIVRGEAWAAAAEGDPPRAQQILLDGAERLAGVPVYAAQLYHEALRAGVPARTLVEPLAALRERCDGRLAAAYAEHAAARAAGDGGALLRSADEFADIGTTRYAAECAAQAAEAFADAGRQDSARRAAARSGELQALGQGGSSPAIRGVDGAAVRLTPREAQLVELAARGLSNAEIADRLVLSVRTVESHVYRAMQKLGVSDRRDL